MTVQLDHLVLLDRVYVGLLVLLVPLAGPGILEMLEGLVLLDTLVIRVLQAMVVRLASLAIPVHQVFLGQMVDLGRLDQPDQLEQLVEMVILVMLVSLDCLGYLDPLDLWDLPEV